MVEEIREPKPRGGAAKEIRTGLFIKRWLEKVDDDSITGMHGALKSEIGKRNLLRAKGKWLRAPTYESFCKYFGHLRRLRLVEFVREEPTEWTHEKLISIRMKAPWLDDQPVPPMAVVPSRRRIYRLSVFGKRPEVEGLWEDPLLRTLFRQALLGTLISQK